MPHTKLNLWIDTTKNRTTDTKFVSVIFTCWVITPHLWAVSSKTQLVVEWQSSEKALFHPSRKHYKHYIYMSFFDANWGKDNFLLTKCTYILFWTRSILVVNLGSVNWVVRLLWSTKYKRPVPVHLASQPGGNGPKSWAKSLEISLKWERHEVTNTADEFSLDTESSWCRKAGYPLALISHGSLLLSLSLFN